MIGDHCSDVDFIRMLMKKYQIELIAWTKGSLGSLLYMQDHDYEIRIPKTEMILDTVGAGDAFAAGFIYGYLKEWDLYKSCRMGNACGAHVVTKPGCANFTPYETEILDFIEENGGF